MNHNQIEQLALDGLAATADAEEQWSFLFRTEGSLEFCYYILDDLEMLDFDPDDIDAETLAWTHEQVKDLQNEARLPNARELYEWRLEKARLLMADGSGYSRQGFIVPIREGRKIEGYAIFDGGVIDSMSDPSLYSVYKTLNEAKEATKDLGILDAAWQVQNVSPKKIPD